MKKMTKQMVKRRLTKFALAGVAILLFSFIPFQQQPPEWKAPPTAKEKKNPIAADAASIAAGKLIYEKDCINCHGKKGRGDGKDAASQDVIVTDLTLPKTQSQTDGELFWKISEGRKPMPTNKKDH